MALEVVSAAFVVQLPVPGVAQLHSQHSRQPLGQHFQLTCSYPIRTVHYDRLQNNFRQKVQAPNLLLAIINKVGLHTTDCGILK